MGPIIRLLFVHMSGGRNLLTKFIPISFFRCISRFKVFQEIRYSNKEILGRPGLLPFLVPQWPKLCKFVSRSDLVLISFWMLTITSDFALFAQKCRCSYGPFYLLQRGNIPGI